MSGERGVQPDGPHGRPARAVTALAQRCHGTGTALARATALSQRSHRQATSGLTTSRAGWQGRPLLGEPQARKENMHFRVYTRINNSKKSSLLHEIHLIFKKFLGLRPPPKFRRKFRKTLTKRNRPPPHAISCRV